MKPFFTSLALLLISSLLFAVDETILQQLRNVNTNWNNIPAFNLQLLEQRQIQSEKELIQTHLKFTIQYLESSKQILSVEQKQNRNACINKLKQYQAQGVFPVNTHHLCRQPYFIDDFNNYCAVGYLLKETGFDKVAQQIHNEVNYAYVKEIPEAYIAGWANKFGFTIDELALIQPNYSTYLRCRNDTFFVGKNTATVCPVLQNDSYGDMTCSGTASNTVLNILDSTFHGTVSKVLLPTDTFFIYQPDTNFVGTDSMRYEVIYSKWGCDYQPDTAVAVFNVLPTSGNYVSFKQGDGNYDGQINNMDFLLLAKNMGEHGSARTFTNANCATTYSTPWNTSYMNYNAASCDADGDGVVNDADFDLVQQCFDKIIDYHEVASSHFNRLVVDAYDTLLTDGERLDIRFVVKDNYGLGNVIPLKAIVMEIYSGFNSPSINMLSTEMIISSVAHDSLSISKNYSKQVLHEYYGEYVHTGCVNIVANQSSVALDSFSLTGNIIARDSIYSTGYCGIRIDPIYALDINDNIIPIWEYFIALKSSKDVTGMDELAPASFSLHPNPATTNVTITTTNEMIGSTITVTDIMGRKMMAAPFSIPNSTFSIANFPNGIYLLTLTAPNGKSATKKLVVSK